MKRLVAAAAVCAAVVLAAGAARANSTTDCFWTIARWGGPTTTVDVWVTIDDFSGVQNLGLSIPNIEMATRQAISIWNEQSGAALRMRYRGTTTQGWIEGAVTVAYRPQPDPFGQGVAGRSWLVQEPQDPYQVQYGSVIFYTGYTWDIGGGSDYETFTPSFQKHRFLPIMVHELGHIAFQIVHPGGTGFIDNGTATGQAVSCSNLSQATVMTPLAYGLPPWPYRNLRAWDKSQAQLRMERRSEFSSITRRTWSVGNWAAPVSTQQYVLYRPGSSTEQLATSALGWVQQDRPGALPRVIRTSSVDAAGTFSAGQTYSVDSTSPIARAATATDSIVAYLAYEDAASGKRRICFRTGKNPTERCANNPALGADWMTLREGVTAAYDPRSKMFLIGAIVDWTVDPDGGLLPRLFVYAVPTDGSTTPEKGTLLPTDKLSFNAPSIACRNARLGCRMFYQDRSLRGQLRWLEAEIDLATGFVTLGAQRTTTLDQFDTPNVVWSQVEDRYRVAFVQDNSTAFAQALTASGTALTALPQLSSGTFISAPVQSTTTCTAPCLPRTHAWFATWW